jgi:hypothetical protein
VPRYAGLDDNWRGRRTAAAFARGAVASVGFAGSISHKRCARDRDRHTDDRRVRGRRSRSASARDADRPSIADRILTEPERYASALDRSRTAKPP